MVPAWFWLLTVASAGEAEGSSGAEPVPPPAVPASPGDTRAAERVRLGEELRALAERQAWSGVERVFLALEAARAGLTYDELVAGAAAARAGGDMVAARDRLARAARIRASGEVVGALVAIDTTYGSVLLAGPRRVEVRLEVGTPPFDPDQRAAIAFAQARVAADGAFAGLLPRGDYRFADQPFTVEPGVVVRIEVDPRPKRDEPERNPP